MMAWYLLGGTPGDRGVRFREALGVAIARHRPDLAPAYDDGSVQLLTDAPVTTWPATGRPRLLLVGEIIPQSAFGPPRAGLPPLPLASDAPVETIADLLVARIWGRYVAIILDDAGATILAEPSGSAPVVILETPGGTIASADLPKWLWVAAGKRPSIDVASLGRALVDPVLATDRALLEQAVVVPPGTMRRLGGGCLRTIFSPAALAAEPVEPIDGAALLSAIVDATIAALGDGPFLVQVSGGLDSSIVLAALKRSGANSTAVTVASDHPGGDERGWARLAAEHCGFALVEHVSGTRPIDHARLAGIAHGVRPCLAGLDDGFEAAIAEVAKAAGARAILTGQGGDDVFGGLEDPVVAIDRVRMLGLRGLSHRALLADAERHDRSIWAMLAIIAGGMLRLPRTPRPPTMAAFLAADLQASATRLPRHVWREHDDALPPAKRLQIAQLANNQIHFMPRPGPEPLATLHPLLAQPILTVALRLPIARLAFGPQDRGLARQAFADRLPAQTLARRLKGETSHHYSRALRADLPALRGLILDGSLVSLGLVDRAAAERILDPAHLAHSPDFRGVALAASLSAWAGYWR